MAGFPQTEHWIIVSVSSGVRTVFPGIVAGPLIFSPSRDSVKIEPGRPGPDVASSIGCLPGPARRSRFTRPGFLQGLLECWAPTLCTPFLHPHPVDVFSKQFFSRGGAGYPGFASLASLGIC